LREKVPEKLGDSGMEGGREGGREEFLGQVFSRSRRTFQDSKGK
jgi:hypothetical protein